MEIFQIDKTELDFGIYKIVNVKAEMIQKFLTNDLKVKVQTALRGGEMESDRVAAASRKALAEGLLTESEAYEFTKES